MPNWPFAGRDADLGRVVARLRDPGCRALVLAGAAGVGKSRLAAEAARRLARTHAVDWVYATQAAQPLPLGAMAPLLPAEPPQGNLLAWAARAIVARWSGRPVLLVVDDAHLLDPASAALVHQLARQVTVLATVRSGESCPDPVTALWRDDSSERVDLGPLNAAATAAVVEGALQGSVAAGLTDRLHSLSEGNVLLLRELVTTAVRRDDAGVWRLRDELLHAPRLIEFADQRMGTLSPDELTVVELVALGEPVGLAELAALTAAQAVESVEERGIVRLDGTDRQILARLAHPLFGEIVRARMPSLRRRRHYGNLAGALDSAGPRPEDALRIAVWRLESGAVGDAASLVAASRLAWAAHDYPLALRLGQAAFDRGGGVDAAIILATLLNQTEHPQQAEAILAEVWDEPCDQRQRTELTLSQAWSLAFGFGRFADAERLIRQTLQRVTQTSLRQDLTVLLMQVTGHSGDVSTAMKICRRLLAEPPDTPAVRAQALNCYAMNAYSAGRYGEAITAAQQALAEHALWCEAVPNLVVPLHVFWWLAAMAQGDLAGAEYAVTSLAAVMTGPADWCIATATLALLRAQLALTYGRAGEAAHLLQDVAAEQLRTPPSATGFTPHCLAVYAVACALLGDTTTAAAAVTVCERASGHPAAMGYRPWQTIARPWVTAASGRLADAVKLARQAAAHSQKLGFPAFETTALHTAVRLGAPEAAADRLAQLAEIQDGPLAKLCADHAQAAARSDGPALDEVSQRFEALQMILHAAETAAQASQAHTSAGRRASARSAAARAWALAARCEGTRTPALAWLQAPGLTRRQYEIARLASSGLTNKQIARQLTVSERTVENHLQAAYTKLGVCSRAELQPLLAGGC